MNIIISYTLPQLYHTMKTINTKSPLHTHTNIC
jgi:hypothetical protein